MQSVLSKYMPLSGPRVQEQANQFVEKLGKENSKASNGWVESFKKRHNVVWNSISREQNDVNMTIVGECKEKIEYVVKDYKPEDMFNCDELVFFWCALPSRTLTVKGDRCTGWKQVKSISETKFELTSTQRVSLGAGASKISEYLTLLSYSPNERLKLDKFIFTIKCLAKSPSPDRTTGS